METIEVGCAMIERQGEFLIAQRCPGMRCPGFWEFPGGQRESHETMEQCLIREIGEELGIRIRPTEFLGRKDFEYPDRKVSLYFYFCDWISGRPSKRDCFDFAWVSPRQMKNYRFLPADFEIIDYLIKTKRES